MRGKRRNTDTNQTSIVRTLNKELVVVVIEMDEFLCVLSVDDVMKALTSGSTGTSKEEK